MGEKLTDIQTIRESTQREKGQGNIRIEKNDRHMRGGGGGQDCYGCSCDEFRPLNNSLFLVVNTYHYATSLLMPRGLNE